MYDLGDAVQLAYANTDSSGNPANAGTVTLTITAPDGTTSTPAVTNPSTGSYVATYQTTQVGLHGSRWLATGVNPGASTDVFTTSDPAILPIVSLADAKAWISLPASSAVDAQKIRDTLANATELAENYCNRSLRRKTQVQRFSGSYANTYLMLNDPPILSMTSVVESGNTLTLGSEYVLDPVAGILYRGIYPGLVPWYPGVDNIIVTYVSGYAAPPLVAVQGVKDIFRWLWQTTQQGPRPGFGQNAQETAYGDALPAWLFRPLDSLVLPGIG